MIRQQHNYIHIPKTGGTSMKYVLEENLTKTDTPKIVMPNEGHAKTLMNTQTDVCFVIRDPWQRFCSGFWERVTMYDRKKLSETEYRNVKSFGYMGYSSLEREILSSVKTPEEFLLYIKNGGTTRFPTPGLFQLTASLEKWLGTLDTFKKHEHKIKLVFDIGSLDSVMLEIYDLKLPKDPFRSRSRKLFDKEQTYSISDENLSWFKDYRKSDYVLLEYIKGQQYFYTGNT